MIRNSSSPIQLNVHVNYIAHHEIPGIWVYRIVLVCDFHCSRAPASLFLSSLCVLNFHLNSNQTFQSNAKITTNRRVIVFLSFDLHAIFASFSHNQHTVNWRFLITNAADVITIVQFLFRFFSSFRLWRFFCFFSLFYVIFDHFELTEVYVIIIIVASECGAIF